MDDGLFMYADGKIRVTDCASIAFSHASNRSQRRGGSRAGSNDN